MRFNPGCGCCPSSACCPLPATVTVTFTGMACDCFGTGRLTTFTLTYNAAWGGWLYKVATCSGHLSADSAGNTSCFPDGASDPVADAAAYVGLFCAPIGGSPVWFLDLVWMDACGPCAPCDGLDSGVALRGQTAIPGADGSTCSPVDIKFTSFTQLGFGDDALPCVTAPTLAEVTP